MYNKFVVWGYLIVLSLGTMLSLYMPKTEAAAKESIVIPGEAIRLRILANSDFDEDQAIKRKVRDAVNAQITLWVQDLTSMEKARTVINAKLPEIQAISEQVVREQGSNQSVKVEFGKVQFPTKLYGQFLYPAGEYQAILITLGKGEGANWWCVLYPPLCFLDFSNGVAVSDGFDEKQTAKAEMAPTVEADVEEPEAAVEPVREEVKVASKSKNELADSKNNSSTKKQASMVNEDKVKQVKKQVLMASVAEVKQVKKQALMINEDVAGAEVKQVKKQALMMNVDGAGAEVMKSKKQVKKAAPVYTAEDEQPVKVKFFVVEMWEKIF